MKIYSFTNDSKHLSLINLDSFLRLGALNRIEADISLSDIQPFDVLIVNIDPFTLTNFNADNIGKMRNKKIAIICDTHHGIMPISRQVAFCLKAGINHIILRFNQRHAPLFKKFGFNVICPVFSPDILLRILSKQIFLPNTQSFRCNKVISIGRYSPAHLYRQNVLRSLASDKELSDQVVITTASSSDEMYSIMSRYSYALNVSLNLDFNRRIIEMILAGCIPFSDRLEASQLSSPFSIFRTSINWFDNIDDLSIQLKNRALNYEYYLTKLIDSQNMIIHLATSSMDMRMREDLLDSVQTSSYSESRSQLLDYKDEFFSLFEYELLLNWSQNLQYKKIKSLSFHQELYSNLLQIIDNR